MKAYQKIVDCTLPITTNMSVPPANRNLPPVEFELIKDPKKDNIQVGFFRSGIHAGTHLDAPRHVLAAGKTIDELDLSYFFGEAFCIDCSDVKPNEPVTAEMLEYASDKIRPGMIVFLYTGWSDKMFGGDEYWSESPYLGTDAAQWLVDHGVKIAGFDFFQEIAAKTTQIDPTKFEVHHIILENGCLNIEHLTNLKELVNQTFDVIAMPLKIVGAEGSPTRVVALL